MNYVRLKLAIIRMYVQIYYVSRASMVLAIVIASRMPMMSSINFGQ